MGLGLTRLLTCVVTLLLAYQQAALGQSSDPTSNQDASAPKDATAEARGAKSQSEQPKLAEIRPSDAYVDQVFREADWVAGGNRVKDPLRKGFQYYAAQRDLYWANMATGTSTGKQFGLLLSRDDGQTWRVLSRDFEFQYIFVHPISGELFAIIAYDWLAPEESGYLQHYYSNKVIRSANGMQWTDITPKPGHASQLTAIFQDPDHPNRICVSGNVIRSVVFQYQDDKFTDWTLIRYFDWAKSHPNAQAEK